MVRALTLFKCIILQCSLNGRHNLPSDVCPPCPSQMAVIIYPQMSVPPVCHNWPSYLHSDVCSPVPPKCTPPSAPPPARILGYSIIRIILQCSLKDMKQSIIRRQSCRTYFNSCFQPVCTLYIPQVKMSNLCLICQIIKLKKKI